MTEVGSRKLRGSDAGGDSDLLPGEKRIGRERIGRVSTERIFIFVSPATPSSQGTEPTTGIPAPLLMRRTEYND